MTQTDPHQSKPLPFSVVSYPERGPWGSSKYRGNTPGHLIKDLILHFKPKLVFDPMAGSGTCGDVCRDLAQEGMSIECIENDLNPDTGSNTDKQFHYNLLSEDAEELLIQLRNSVDLIFWHPPYWNMIDYKQGAADFSSGSYESYLNRMARALELLAPLLNRSNPNARIALQLGDLRRADRKYYWITRDVLTPSVLKRSNLEISDILIRIQRRMRSNWVVYKNESSLIRIIHETVSILKWAR